MEGSSSAPTLLNLLPLPTDQNARVVTTQEGERPRRGLTGRVVPTNNERNNEEENHHAGISTELSLYEDRLKMRKKLAVSDLRDLSRLLLPRQFVLTDVLPHLDEAMTTLVNSTTGLPVIVRNVDEREDHELVLGRWAPCYVLKGGWIRHFVKGRGLAVGDEIGMFWNPDDGKFYFTVHRRVARGPNNAAG